MFISCSENEEVIINSEQVSKNNTNEDRRHGGKRIHREASGRAPPPASPGPGWPPRR